MGIVKNIFNLKLLVGSLITALGVGLVAWVLSLVVGITASLGAWSSVITAIILLMLLGFAVKIRPGAEDIISLLTIALIVIIVFGILSAFGLGFVAPTFALGTPIGFATAAIVLFLGAGIALRITKRIPGM